VSIPVELSGLADAIAQYRFAYLMTTNAAGAPHAVTVSPVLQGGELVVHGTGRRTREHASQRPAVGLVWPPRSATEYSLIVDGIASVGDDGLRITPTRAVLHRPGPSRTDAPGPCTSDCVEVDVGARKPT